MTDQSLDQPKAVGDLLFLRNGFINLCMTFLKKYFYITLDFFLNCHKLHIGY